MDLSSPTSSDDLSVPYSSESSPPHVIATVTGATEVVDTLSTVDPVVVTSWSESSMADSSVGEEIDQRLPEVRGNFDGNLVQSSTSSTDQPDVISEFLPNPPTKALSSVMKSEVSITTETTTKAKAETVSSLETTVTNVDTITAQSIEYISTSENPSEVLDVSVSIDSEAVSSLTPVRVEEGETFDVFVEDENIIEDDISAFLPPGFVFNSKFKPEVNLAQFGKVSTTTLDPISEILANVVILDVTDYLPKGYEFTHEEPEEEVLVESLGNINDLLIQKEKEIKFKPGKLNGKKLAAISNELKEAEQYYSTFGGKKQKLKLNKDKEGKEKTEASTSKPKKLYGWKEPNEGASQNDRKGKELSDASLEFSAESIFASILGGVDIKIDPVKEEAKLTSASSSNPVTKVTTGPTSLPLTSRPITSAPKTTTPRSTTTTTSKPTTPGVCGEFCSLAGTIVIKSGLDWSEELLNTFTDVYKDVSDEVVREMSKVFEHVYYGSAFEFASIDAYSKEEENVLVDFYLQFSGIVFKITTKDVKESFEELLEVHDNKLMMGKYEIDLNSSYFLVVDSSVPMETITYERYGVILPDWAWLVVVGGIFSTLIIGVLGVLMGIQKYRDNQIVRTRVLNPKTLKAFKGQQHFDTVEVDNVVAYANDKRDMWTLQKVHQAEAKKSKIKSYYADSHSSGRGSVMSGTSKNFSSKVSSFGKSGKLFTDRFPSLGKGSSKASANPNESNAELLGGLDSTDFDESREILEKDIADRSTSYENDKEDYEGGVGSNYMFEDRDNFGDCGNFSRTNLLESLGDEGMPFDDSESSLDAVSDGPSERF
eukprot:GFUD01045424.1.p1 GENE.GFUD01045424.1~~GFUD01045424.1.p1  ORF type:complete len:925 (-),score=213.08 GFUD01045424.1:155-2629(-)